MAKQRKSKVIRVNYGIFGNTNTGKIQKTIQQWIAKGYDLHSQEDVKHRNLFWVSGYTVLTFIEREKVQGKK